MSAAVDQMRHSPIPLGRYDDGSEASLSFPDVVNPHVLIAGKSGTGKTYIIRELVRHYYERGITTMVLDTQGDIVSGNEQIPDEAKNVLAFQYGGGDASVNPLRIHEPPERGGAYTAIEDTLETVRILRPNIGQRQLADLRHLIIGCYRAYGINIDDPSTWDKEGPDWHGFEAHVRELVSYMDLGVPSLLAENFQEQVRKTRSSKAYKEEGKFPDGVSEWAVKFFRSVVDQDWSTDPEAGRLRSAERVASLHDLIEATLQSGLFGQDRLRLRPGCINIFDLSALRSHDLQAMIRVLLDRAFTLSVRRCERLNPVLPWLSVVLDEAKHAISTGRGPMSPVNRIATEGRKFGVGMICGVQYPQQLNEATRNAFATTVALPVESHRWKEVERMMRVSSSALSSLTPRSTALLKLNEESGRRVHLFR